MENFAIMSILVSFILLELAYTSEKNKTSSAFQKLLVYLCSLLSFTVFGYGIVRQGSLIAGFSSLGLLQDVDSSFFIEAALAAVVAAGATSAIAERTKTFTYILLSMVISGIIFPLIYQWAQADGWLTTMGYFDGAGASYLQLTIGFTAVMSAWIIGPRLGKYENNKVNALPGGMLFLGVVGVFLAWLGWSSLALGLSGGSLDENELLRMRLTLFLLPAISALATYVVGYLQFKKTDISIILNGFMAGILTATITGPYLTLVGSLITGIFVGGALGSSIRFFDKNLKIDDPVGTISIHGTSSVISLIMIGLLAEDDGLFYGGGFALLINQLVGILVIAFFVAAVLLILLKVIDNFFGLRLSAEEEMIGKDGSVYHLPVSYGGLATVNFGKLPVKQDLTVADESELVEIDEIEQEKSDNQFQDFQDIPKETQATTIRRFEIITNPNKLERLTQELNEIGVMGMNVTTLTGFGVQKGHTTYYRGVEVSTNFLPKIKLETIVSTISTETMIAAIRRALYTGHIGDGKIFISPISGVVRVSTGATDKSALIYDTKNKK